MKRQRHVLPSAFNVRFERLWARLCTCMHNCCPVDVEHLQPWSSSTLAVVLGSAPGQQVDYLNLENFCCHLFTFDKNTKKWSWLVWNVLDTRASMPALSPRRLSISCKKDPPKQTFGILSLYWSMMLLQTRTTLVASGEFVRFLGEWKSQFSTTPATTRKEDWIRQSIFCNIRESGCLYKHCHWHMHAWGNWWAGGQAEVAGQHTSTIYPGFECWFCPGVVQLAPHFA